MLSRKIEAASVLDIVEAIYKEISITKSWSINMITEIIQKISISLNIAVCNIAMLLRIGLLGKAVSPGITQVINIFNKESLLKRIKKVITMLKYNY